MENTLQLILKKLGDIESRLHVVETVKVIDQSKTEITENKTIQKDPLFGKAVAIINKIESEISTSEMQKHLGVDAKRAETILEQLEAAGFGTTYMGEA